MRKCSSVGKLGELSSHLRNFQMLSFESLIRFGYVFNEWGKSLFFFGEGSLVKPHILGNFFFSECLAPYGKVFFMQ